MAHHKLRKRPLILAGIVVVLGLAAAAYFWVGRCAGAAYDETCQVYFGHPTVTDVSPDEGDMAGGTVVNVSGTKFGPGVRVWFGEQPASRVDVINSIRLRAVAPAGKQAGPADVSVARGNGPKASLKSSFRYDADSEITSVTPARGPRAGGTTVTIRGQGFSRDARVDFGGTFKTKTTYVDANTLTAVTPAHDPGVVVVNVFLGETELSKAEAFIYE